MKSTIAGVIVFALAVFRSPVQAATYTFIGSIAVPASADNNVGGTFQAFGWSYFDPTTQLDYVADRSNASVDIFSAATDTFVGRIGGSGHLFAGQTATTSTSGPNAVQVIDLPGQHQVYASNASSTALGFNIVSPTNNPQFTTVNTGGTFRVDEMSFDPNTNRILATNSSDTPAFATLIDAKTGTIIKGNITIPGQIPSGGLEGSTYNPITQTFFVVIPQLTNSGPGGIAEIDPRTGNVLRVINFASFGIANFSPVGIAAAANGQMMIGDGATNQSIIFDPTGAGHIVASLAQITGVDQVWYDPTTGRWFLAARSNFGGPILGVVDSSTDAVVQLINTNITAHSVAVDPVSGDIFVPYGASSSLFTNTVCPNGCIAIFAETASAVPEPSTWAMMLLGFAGLGFAFRHSRRRVFA
jgi:PEP-CTERM motif